MAIGSKLLEMSEISMIPANSDSMGLVLKNKYDFSVVDQSLGIRSLPIFASPMSSITDEHNWKIWESKGIRTIIPRTVDINIRIEACQYTFAAFSKDEARAIFGQSRKMTQSRLLVCIESVNGQESELFSLGRLLKQMYGNQMLLMGGNLSNPKAYVDYCKSGFDYVRLGATSGSLVSSRFGFHYPTASLLIDTMGVKTTAAIGLPNPKIILDGGIEGPSDILKALVMGADYVMIGREFSRLIEAAGPVYKRGLKVDSNGNKKGVAQVVSREELLNGPRDKDSLRSLAYYRWYRGNTSLETQANLNGYSTFIEWVNKDKNAFSKIRPSDCTKDAEISVTSTIDNWLKEMSDCFIYCFDMVGAGDLEYFKRNTKYVIV
jgi:hypothetical protein